MARSCRFTWSGVLTAILLTGSAAAQPFDAPEARITRGQAGQPLARGVATDPAGVVRDYLRSAGHTDATVDSVALAGRSVSARSGVSHLRFVQRIDGLDVYGVYVKASVDADGGLVSVIENLVTPRGVAPAGLPGGEGRALAIGLQHVHGGAQSAPGLLRQQGNVSVFARTPFFHREPTVTRVAVPVGAALRVGYLVETWAERGNQLHHTLVGGDGAVLGVEARTAQDSYNVFRKDPEKAAQEVVSNPADATASKSGWLFGATQLTTNIVGHNAIAYLDIDANNQPDAGGDPVAGGAFTSAANLGLPPTTDTNRAVATQNLFYQNNVLHDVLYHAGFDEAAGNFQRVNPAGATGGGDPVLAEVQDGSGTDNANFATPADGSSPRMQMYLWTGLGNAEVVHLGTTYLAQLAAFSPTLSSTGLTLPLALADDGVAPTADACERFPRTTNFANQIAIVDRGACDFIDKVNNAARAGAAGVIVVNNTDGLPITMGGSGSARIPAVMITKADGQTLRTALGSATMRATAAPPQRDSSLDADVVFHEYGHGLTWRMIGGMSGVMAGAIGEGMSDVLALLLSNDDLTQRDTVTHDDRIGEYSASDPLGIRSAPYEGYLRTYADFSATGVHFDGEIYGAIGWLLRKTYLEHRHDTAELLADIVDGMNYTPATPTFEQMRDGILTAVIGDPDRTCHVWQAFAKYGVGEGAKATVRRSRATIVESFTPPAACQ